MKFVETKPTCVKVVQLVNLDGNVTDLINKEFAWWFGGAPDMCVTTECRTTIPQSSVVSQVQGEKLDGDMETNMETPVGGDSLLVRCSKKKEYIPEKFLTFGAVSLFSVIILNVNLSLMEDCITVQKNE